MRTYVWSDEYSVGVPEIDAQHKKLFIALRELQLELYGVVDSAVIKERIVELQTYCLAHFADESALFGTAHAELEMYEEHILQHENFVTITNEFAHRAETEGAELVKEICQFLSEWLVNHILHMDKKTFTALHTLQTEK